MQIQGSGTTPLPTSASTAADANPASTAAAVASTDALGNENTFLQLLVAQIQNQDPTQPMDSSTFLTQLAEFSSSRTIDRYSAGCRGTGSVDDKHHLSTSSTSGS